MTWKRPKLLRMALAVPLALLAAGCPIQETETAADDEDTIVVSQLTEENVLDLRSLYRVTLIDFKEADPAVAEAVGEGAGEASAAAIGEEAIEGEAGYGEEGEAEEGEEFDSEEGPETTRVLFDLIIRFVGPGEPLPGITVEVEHSDTYGQEKGKHLVWAETPELRRGEKRNFSFDLEIPDFETGDEFSVMLRSDVPPEELGDYREFSQAAP